MSEHTGKDATAPSEASQGGSNEGRLAAAGEEWARSVWGHVRGGATHFHEAKAALAGHPVRQFFHGLALPFHIGRALRGDSVAWRRYLKVGIVQCLVILAVALSFTGSASEAVDAAREEVEEESRQDAERARLKEQRKQEGQQTVRQVREALAAEGLAMPPVSEGPAATGAEQKAAPQAREEEKFRVVVLKSPREELGFFDRQFQFWAAVFATLQLIQWVVIALSRDYHDAISRDASLLTAVEPEDEPLTPRIRVDVPWMQKKLTRRVRGFWVFLVGLPALVLLAAPLCFAANLLTVFISVWSAYWLVVFTAGKSGRAWEDSSEREPWPLRAWTWMTTRVPGLRWGLLQGYGRFWAASSRTVFSPALEMEKQPWAFGGLAVIRALAMLPLLKCFLRPLIPVAAAHLIAAQRATVTPALPTEVPAQPAASATAA